jgi:hypothetical protein
LDSNTERPIYQFFSRAVWVLNSIQNNHDLNFYAERSILTDLIRAVPDNNFGKRKKNESGIFQVLKPSSQTSSSYGKDFWGVRYPLVCWLDEIFTSASSPWADMWNEQKVEVELYATNDRAWKFWEQAKLSEEFNSTDILEVFFLCTVFGFQGTLIERQGELEGWQKKTAIRFNSTKKLDIIEWDSEMTTNVPPRISAYAFRKMKTILGILLMILLPYFIFLSFFSITH